MSISSLLFAICATIFGSIVAPLFLQGISTTLADWEIYSNRKFDDGNPETQERCWLHNLASGELEEIRVLAYEFDLFNPLARTISFSFQRGDEWFEEKMSLRLWKQHRKCVKREFSPPVFRRSRRTFRLPFPLPQFLQIWRFCYGCFSSNKSRFAA